MPFFFCYLGNRRIFLDVLGREGGVFYCGQLVALLWLAIDSLVGYWSIEL